MADVVYLALLVIRFVDEGGKFDDASIQLTIETKLAPKTNIISEKDFAKLGRLLCEKPNATTLSLEGMILFANNQTSQWLNSKPVEKKDLLRKHSRI